MKTYSDKIKIALLSALLLMPVCVFGFSRKSQDFSKSDFRTMKKILSSDITEYFDIDENIVYFPERLQEFKASDEGRKLEKELNDKKNEIRENIFYITRRVPNYDVENNAYRIDLQDISFTQRNTQPNDIPFSSTIYFLNFVSTDPNFTGEPLSKLDFFITPGLDKNTVNYIEIHSTEARVYFNIVGSNRNGEFVAVPIAVEIRNDSNGEVYYEYIVDNSQFSEKDMAAILKRLDEAPCVEIIMASSEENGLVPPPPPIKGEPKENSEPKTEQIFQVVEEVPQFPGGEAALMRWMNQNIHYPESCATNGVEGTCVVKFVIEKDGTLSKPMIVKGVDKELDAEAVRVIMSMPVWKPGKVNGQAVRSYFMLPVRFRL